MDLMNDLAHALHVTVIVELLGVPLLRQYRSELRLVLGYSGLSRKINYSYSRYVSLISFFIIFACILTEGWPSCF